MGTWEHGLGRRHGGGAIGNHNFDAQTHRQLYDKIHGGPGYSAARTVDDAWGKFLDVMDTARAELEKAIRASGAVWQGAAGEGFTDSNAPLVQWADDARAAVVASRASLESQALSYVDAKGRMREPVEVTSTANEDFLGIPAGFTHLVGGQTDQDVQEAQAQEAKRFAVAVMNGYRDRASAAVESLGEFTPPPSVTTQVVEPTAVERSGRPENPTSTQERTTSEEERPGPAEPSVHAAPEAGDVDRTATSAVTAPSDTPPRSTPGQVTPPQHAPAPPTTSPVGIASPASRSSATHRPTGRPGGSSAKPGSGAKGGTSRGAGGGAVKPYSSGPHGGSAAAPAPGPGGSSGVGNESPANRTSTAAAVRGVTGSPPPAGGLTTAPRTADGEDDLDHETAPYLEEVEDVWGVDAVPRVAPPVIGEDDR